MAYQDQPGERAFSRGISLHRLSKLLNPRSIAVLGASPRPEAMGNTVLKNLMAAGYSGTIYAIHPSATEVLGVQCYKTVQALPSAVDCLVIALGADKVLPALREMLELNIRTAVLFASGFAEAGPEGAKLQRQVVDFCRENTIDLCGPNCLGLFSAKTSSALYSASLPENLRSGELALVSHSGSACIALSNLNRFGFSYLISAGNGAVTDVHDYLDFIAEDDGTRVVALFLEALRDPDRFAMAIAKLRKAGKSVVALKVGRSSSGAAASAAHTGSLATPDTALQAFFRRHGVILVEDYDELVETCSLLIDCTKVLPAGGLGVLNVSGGELALICDIIERTGLSLPTLGDETIARLKGTLPDFASPQNPLDATGVAVFDMNMYGDCLLALAEDPAIALVAVSQDCPSTMGAGQAAIYRELAKTVARVSAAIEKPIVFLNNVSGPIHHEVLQPLTHAGVPALTGMRNSVLAISHLLDRSRAVVPDTDDFDRRSLRQSQWVSRLQNGKPLTERDSKRFLADHGMNVTQERLATAAEEAVRQACNIGFPVALKIESEDLPHKTEVGGVVLNLRDEDEVRAGYQQILSQVGHHSPNARIAGVLVQEMVQGGVEAILGVATHRPFGPGVVVGGGGVLVELLKDSAFDMAPVDSRRAAELLAGTRLDKLLNGFRGAPPADRDALVAALVRLSQIALAYQDEVEAIDLNPVCVLPQGRGAIVVDALVVRKADTFSEAKYT